MISLEYWMVFLRRSDALIGVPLVLGGLALMLMGWRLWKVCVVISFALIGVGVGSAWAGDDENQWIYALACGLALGAASLRPAKHAVAVLGGLIGSSLIMYVLVDKHITGTTLWLIGAAVFIGASAMAYLNRRMVVIAVTSVLGAGLLLSGIVAFLMASPRLYGTFSSMATNSLIVVPFFILVPTVMSCFYQIADVHKNQAEL